MKTILAALSVAVLLVSSSFGSGLYDEENAKKENPTGYPLPSTADITLENVRDRYTDYTGKVIQITFYYRSEINKISEDSYYTTIFDKKGAGAVIQFPPQLVKWFTIVPPEFDLQKFPKGFSIYITPTTADLQLPTGAKEAGPLLVAVGRVLHKKMGDDHAYEW